jgi:ABC-type molybdate transport system substrate-binding protein
MSIRKFKRLAMAVAVVAVLSPPAQAASTITVFASPAVATAAVDVVAAFIDVTNSIVDPATGATGLGYSVSLQVLSDADAQAAIIDAAAAGTGPDLFLSQSAALPKDLIARGLTLDGQLIKFAKDSLVLYSSAGKVANLQSILTGGQVDNAKLLLSSLKLSIPNPALADPYGLSAKKLLGGGASNSLYSKLDKKGILVKTIDSVSAYGSVEYVDKADGGADLGFTGLNQICNASDGTNFYEEGSKHWIVPSSSGLDVQLAGVAVANSANQSGSPGYIPAQDKELKDFVSFLSGTVLAPDATTGKDILAGHCYH